MNISKVKKLRIDRCRGGAVLPLRNAGFSRSPHGSCSAITTSPVLLRSPNPSQLFLFWHELECLSAAATNLTPCSSLTSQDFFVDHFVRNLETSGLFSGSWIKQVFGISLALRVFTFPSPYLNSTAGGTILFMMPKLSQSICFLAVLL